MTSSYQEIDAKLIDELRTEALQKSITVRANFFSMQPKPVSRKAMWKGTPISIMLSFDILPLPTLSKGKPMWHLSVGTLGQENLSVAEMKEITKLFAHGEWIPLPSFLHPGKLFQFGSFVNVK